VIRLQNLQNSIADLTRQAGIVGAGGAGFPTHVKLEARVDCLIVNGAECEPLVTVDQALMSRYSVTLAKTLYDVGASLGAEKIKIAIKEKHKKVIAIMEDALCNYPNMSVHKLEDFYPAGDELVTVYEVTGRRIPQGGIPLEAGSVVINVETLWNISEAMEGKMNTHKWVTVAGRVERPGVYRAPLGISKRDLLEAAGGIPRYDERVIEGGPMMGSLLDDIDGPVVKTTKSLLTLPQGGPVVQNALRQIDFSLRQAQACCCQCRLCTDICPRQLLGYSCEPNKTILAASYSWQTGNGGISQALACSECGACDHFSCPMGLSPRRVNQMLKKKLLDAGVADPNKGLLPSANFWRPYRKIPSSRLASRLCVSKYSSPVFFHEAEFFPESVALPLRQHIGAPAIPVVKEGETVKRGQLVASIPEGTRVSSNIFASIDGVISGITESGMTIARGKTHV
jgi:Na+-translocating ferredoxin:NAD+ oxidoreductase RnfC subunit